MLWVEDQVGGEKGTLVSGDSSSERFFKNRKKRNWSRSQGRGKCQKDLRGWVYCAGEGPF